MPDLIVERAGGVVTATLNRPEKKNALTYGLFDALGALFDEVSASDADRALVLRGAGGSFSSGMDLSDRPEGVQPGSRAALDRIHAAALKLHRCTKPTIAAVDGLAVGAGMSLAIGCDLVYASSTARFCAIFARRGLSVDFGMSYVLPRLVGLQAAKRLAFLAEMVDASEAQAIGLVAQVVEPDRLDDVVGEVAARLAVGPTVALSNSKSLLDASLGRTMAEAVDDEAAAQARSLTTADAAEAIAAFLEKRDATFTGR